MRFEKIKGGYRVCGECKHSFLAIPKWHFGRKVIALGRLTGVVKGICIPGNVLRIEDSALEGHEELEIIVVPSSLIGVGRNAFAGCSKLEKFDASYSSLSVIGGGAFCGCESLQEVLLPDWVASIGAGAFKDCKTLTSFRNPESNKVIEEKCFWGCEKLTEFVCGEGVSMAKDAFTGTKVKGVRL